MLRIDTHPYVAVHGHEPRQPRGQSVCAWAFRIDQGKVPVVITASYRDALHKAKSRARWCVQVLPESHPRARGNTSS